MSMSTSNSSAEHVRDSKTAHFSGGDSTAPGAGRQGPRQRRTTRLAVAAIVVALVCGAAWYSVAQQAGAGMHPVEFALRAYCGPIADRIVVRDGPGKNDIWLFSSASFDEIAARVQRAISGRKELPGGLRFGSWTYIEPTKSYWIDMAGSAQTRVFMSRHLKGTLLVLHEIGNAAQAPSWTPPYRPLPIDLPHGPVR
jgi:hypothetical protein